MKKIIISLLILLATTLMVSADEKSESKDKSKEKAIIDTNAIIWHKYDEGIKLAEETDRLIMINFTTSWCGYCKKMNRTTFKDPEVVKLLNNEFVSIKVDCESKLELDVDGYKITERNLARSEFGVRSYPVYWFMKSNKEKLAPIKGYRGTNDFLDALYYIKDELHLKIKWEEYRKQGGHKGEF
ncbi:MAG: DUF255 domain-containing protein [candidate division Zixibacteria bacterium]|nr:DUF255 domain-containing protein [candidate division Zixibacteria bacterium]